MTAGKTAIETQYLRDSITGSATGNSREYAVRLRTAGLVRKDGKICESPCQFGEKHKTITDRLHPAFEDVRTGMFHEKAQGTLHTRKKLDVKVRKFFKLFS